MSADVTRCSHHSASRESDAGHPSCSATSWWVAGDSEQQTGLYFLTYDMGVALSNSEVTPRSKLLVRHLNFKHFNPWNNRGCRFLVLQLNSAAVGDWPHGTGNCAASCCITASPAHHWETTESRVRGSSVSTCQSAPRKRRSL